MLYKLIGWCRGGRERVKVNDDVVKGLALTLVVCETKG